MSNNKNVLFLREEYGNGQGTYIYPNGEKYEGDWKNGKYHGHGTFTYPDGNMYVGEFKDGLKNGQGTLTSPYGEKYEGKFKDGGKLYQKLRFLDHLVLHFEYPLHIFYPFFYYHS